MPRPRSILMTSKTLLPGVHLQLFRHLVESSPREASSAGVQTTLSVASYCPIHLTVSLWTQLFGSWLASGWHWRTALGGTAGVRGRDVSPAPCDTEQLLCPRHRAESSDICNRTFRRQPVCLCLQVIWGLTLGLNQVLGLHTGRGCLRLLQNNVDVIASKFTCASAFWGDLLQWTRSTWMLPLPCGRPHV